MADENRIYQQIEETADLYGPAVYELLTFYNTLTTQPDELDGQFIPITTVPNRSAKDGKIFAVGILPPSANITGRLLDRSASIAAITGSSEQTLDIQADKSGVQGTAPIPTGPISTNSQDFYENFVVMCNRLGCQPENLAQVLNNESGMNPAARACRTSKGAACKCDSGPDCKVVAKGLNQLIYSTARGLGMSDEEWNSYENQSATQQLKWVEKSLKGSVRGKTAGQIYASNFGSFHNPNGSMYDGSACKKGYAKCEYQELAYKSNIAFDKPGPDGKRKGYITPDDVAATLRPLSAGQKAQIDAAKRKLGMSTSNDSAVKGDGSENTNWQKEGSANAGEANKTIDKTADKNLNKTGLGLKFLAAQDAAIKALRADLDRMARTPPLRLLVNPQSFKHSMEKVIADGAWGRNGHIIEHWGDNQDKIEGSGKIAAFYSLDIEGGGPNGGDPGNSPGLGRTARQFSASYQNLLALWLLYKSNGGVWQSAAGVLGDKNLSHVKYLQLVGSIYIYYDDILYIGSFDSFNINEEDSAPFTLNYDFSFTVRAWFLLDRTDDPQTYGAPQLMGATDQPAATTGSPTAPTAPTVNAQPAPEVPLDATTRANLRAQGRSA